MPPSAEARAEHMASFFVCMLTAWAIGKTGCRSMMCMYSSTLLPLLWSASNLVAGTDRGIFSTLGSPFVNGLSQPATTPQFHAVLRLAGCWCGMCRSALDMGRSKGITDILTGMQMAYIVGTGVGVRGLLALKAAAQRRRMRWLHIASAEHTELIEQLGQDRGEFAVFVSAPLCLGWHHRLDVCGAAMIRRQAAGGECDRSKR
ncbi:hypothetical protein DL89DRAFT_16827 [Linderina pennispora]|uniref:Uncharacterized protein n=1 Tax=Linderina pennispora TaxID=61395 RepID=A0A1Y1WMN3_9FUNG|nr:uncharacterized protein DL89DRAFT_16827 [Linderina pennispora]ORX74466.1 hypothetical protein DL89DRAFT_16827 [Linderina pennispora]